MFRRTALFLICYLVGASISTLAEELRATELQRNCSLLGDPPDKLTREEANLVLRCVSWWEGYLDRLKTEKSFPRSNRQFASRKTQLSDGLSTFTFAISMTIHHH